MFSNRNMMIVVLFDSSFFIYFKGMCFLNSTEVWDEITDLTYCLIFMAVIGYAFLLFQEESSVQALIDACIEEDGKLYLCVSSPTIKDKPVSKCYSNLKLQMKVSQKLF